MNAISVPATAKTPRSRTRAVLVRPAPAKASERRRGLRTRRLAAALAAVLALGGMAGSAQAASEEPQSIVQTSSEQTLWEAIKQQWKEWLEEEPMTSLNGDDDGGSVDPETGIPRTNP